MKWLEERRRRAGRLVGRGAADVGEVVDALVALHATDPATVFLSVGARLADPARTVERVEAALYGEERGLVRMLAMRRTMFAVPRGDAAVFYAAAGRQIAAKERQKLLAFLAEGGGWDEPWLAGAEAAVQAAAAPNSRVWCRSCASR
jgi:hypothetical protein